MSSGKEEMVVYWGSGSPPCWRALIAIHEKAVTECKIQLLSFDDNQHRTEELLKINPRGEMPIFYHGDIIVNESMGIADYLEKIFPTRGTKLLPDDPRKLVKVLQRKYEALNVFRLGNEDLLYWFWDFPKEVTEDVMRRKKDALVVELLYWEKLLSQEPEMTYIAGADFSMADVVIFPSLALLVRMGLNIEDPRFPLLRRYYNLMLQRPSIQVTWPVHWKTSTAKPLLADL